MKKLLLTASALVLGLAFATDAMADCNGVYVGVRAGTAKHKYSVKDGSNKMDGLKSHVWALSGLVGYRYNYYRTELEYVYRQKDDWKVTDSHNSSSKSDFQTKSMMWNHYVDFMPYNWWSPYLGAGIGFTKMKYSDTTTSAYGDVDDKTSWFNNTPTRFTWSVGGGATLKVTNKFNVDAGYRYYDMGAIHKMDVKSHEFYTGIRYVF